jgi:serine/threonine-protein kinase
VAGIEDPIVNSLFDGRYRIVRKLGAGGMATVYLAQDQELGRSVAIKILNERHANEQFVERFRQEAKNAASLSHPNIVSIYDRGEAEGTYYIAMEYLDGHNLKELILEKGPSPIPVAIDYARQILSALKFAHRHGIVHRDIKPHNVVVDPDGQLKVTDFGIARAGASQMTEVGSIIGTAQYLSPEQARGAPVDPTSDLYSLGIVLYELLTGTVPFNGETPVEIAMKHLQATPEPPSAKRPDVPPELDQIVLRALAKNPRDRFQSAEEMDSELARVGRGLGVSRQTEEAATAVLAGAAILAPFAEGSTETTMVAPAAAPVVPPPPRPDYYGYEPPPRRRRPLWPWFLALGVLIALGIGGWYGYRTIHNKLSSNAPVAVPFVEGLKQAQAEEKIRNVELKPVVQKVANAKTPSGVVFHQDPAAGVKLEKQGAVTLLVSTGKPSTKVPAVIGQTSTDAVALLVAAHLQANVVDIASNTPQGIVTGQDPKAGTKVDQGTTVRINVSKGPVPYSVPTVTGETFDVANAQLQNAGFLVARKDVASNADANTVIEQSPAGGAAVPKGSTVTLTVSKGPPTAALPDVTGQDESTARATLQSAGFKVAVQQQSTSDPTQDGIVLLQSPGPGTQQPPHSTVTLTVGKYVAATTTTTPTTTTATFPTTTTTPTVP